MTRLPKEKSGELSFLRVNTCHLHTPHTFCCSAMRNRHMGHTPPAAGAICQLSVRASIIVDSEHLPRQLLLATRVLAAHATYHRMDDMACSTSHANLRTSCWSYLRNHERHSAGGMSLRSNPRCLTATYRTVYVPCCYLPLWFAFCAALFRTVNALPLYRVWSSGLLGGPRLVPYYYVPHDAYLHTKRTRTLALLQPGVTFSFGLRPFADHRAAAL